MAIAYDAASNVAAGTGDLSWTHTPVGTPRGVLVLIVQNAGATDEIVGVTYGGVAMAEVALSPLLHTTGSEDGAIFGYFLGSSVPTGPQTVAVDANATGSSKRPVAISVTAASDVGVDDTSAVELGTGANPTVTVQTTVGRTTFVAGALHSGQNAPGSIAPGSDYSEILEHDFGNQNGAWMRRTANPTGGDVVVSWTVASEENAVLAVALRELVVDKTGLAASPFTGAGGRAITHDRTGAAVSVFRAFSPLWALDSATGHERHGTGYMGGRVDGWIFQKAGNGATAFTGDGAQEATLNQAGTATTEFVAAGSSEHEPAETGDTFDKAGDATAPFSVSGGDSFDASETGAGVASLTGSGERHVEYDETGTTEAPFTAAGEAASFVVVDKTGAATMVLAAAGGRELDANRDGTATLTFAATGANDQAAEPDAPATGDPGGHPGFYRPVRPIPNTFPPNWVTDAYPEADEEALLLVLAAVT